jgi:hypothetical protein
VASPVSAVKYGPLAHMRRLRSQLDIARYRTKNLRNNRDRAAREKANPTKDPVKAEKRRTMQGEAVRALKKRCKAVAMSKAAEGTIKVSSYGIFNHQ